MSIIWLSLRDRGIPQQTARTIIASWRDSPKKQYLASIRQWGRLCVIRKIHPCRASVLDGLNFLQYLFILSVSYSSVNTARSVLSFILPRNDCGSFGQHFLVKKFVRGVSNLRIPTKYSYIWDVLVVLEFFRHLPENNLLPLKLLSLKLVMLVALVSGQRVQTLSLLDLSFNNSVYDSIVFVIPNMTKTSRPGKPASQIVLSEYGQDKRLCVVSCLIAYLLKTLEYRTSSKLFLGLQKPHKAVGSQTLSRWLKATLRLSGVRIDIFLGHSTRAASSSKAKLAGLSLTAF